MFCSERSLGTAEMPTIMTSDVREDFQYSLVSYFVNTSSFWLFLNVDFSQKCFGFYLNSSQLQIIVLVMYHCREQENNSQMLKHTFSVCCVSSMRQAENDANVVFNERQFFPFPF